MDTVCHTGTFGTRLPPSVKRMDGMSRFIGMGQKQAEPAADFAKRIQMVVQAFVKTNGCIMLGQNRFAELLSDAGLDLAAYFTESTDADRNKIKRDVEKAYLEECVIQFL